MVSLIYGAITHHFVNSHLPYCNKINDYGSINNQTLMILIGNKDRKIGFLKGKDSACGDIIGPMASLTLNDNLEFLIGGYNTNYKDFSDLKIEPSSVEGITPVLGFNFRLPLYESKDLKITVDNLISYGIIAQALRIDFL